MRTYLISIPLFWGVLFGSIVPHAGTFSKGPSAMKKRYYIESGSRLYLDGSSNVNSFTCDCKDYWPAQTLEIDQNGSHASFRNTAVQITTKKFDCHNGKIDLDMQKALKADIFPLIRIELLETWVDPVALKGASTNWVNVRSKVKITLAGVSKTHTIDGKIRKIALDKVHILGEKKLWMSDFGIAPPEAMFGLIKVNDEITFHFDLKVRFENQP